MPNRLTSPGRGFSLRGVISELKRSPLEAAHVALGAKLVPFAGWNMPVQYTSIIDEHTAVRKACGIFDISHMGQFIVSGPAAALWLNGLLTNDIARLGIGQGQYTLMLNESGGVIDDLIVYRTGDTEFFLVVNASMIDDDFCWMDARRDEGVELRNESEQWAGMAIQGPDAVKVFAAVCTGETLPPRNGIMTTAAGSVVCRTGYTGEDGFEFFAPAEEATGYWDRFLAAGAKPCGLGARDTLRLEMGYMLYGNDINDTTSPLEAGLGWITKLDKGDFIGRDLMVGLKEKGLKKKLIGLVIEEKGGFPRRGYSVMFQGEEVGQITSGGIGPSLGYGIGLAYVPAALAKPGQELEVAIRNRTYTAKVVRPPFLKR